MPLASVPGVILGVCYLTLGLIILINDKSVEVPSWVRVLATLALLSANLAVVAWLIVRFA